MGYLFTVVILVCISGALVLLLNKSWFQVIPLTIFLCIFILYFGGIFHLLRYGLYTMLILAVISIVFIFTRRKEIKRLWNYELKTFLIIAIAIFLVHVNRGLGHRDEYSHWALTVKNMFYTNLLGNSLQSITCFKEYPPATAVIEWMMMRLDGKYSEANLFRGISLIHVSIMLASFRSLIDQCKKRKNAAVIGALLFPTMFFYLYTETIVDATLGLLFGYLLYHYFEKNEYKYRLLAIGLGTFVLVLTKASGTGIVALFILIMIADGLSKNRMKDAAICVVTSVLGLMIGKVSWNLSLVYEKAIVYWGTGEITLSKVMNLITNMGENEKSILSKYIRDYAYPNTSLNFISISYIMWFIIIILLTLYLNKYLFYDIKRTIRIILGIIVSIVFYSSTLLMLYFFVWKAALNEGSFYRYMNSLYFGLVMAFGILALQVYGHRRDKNNERLAVVVLALSVCLCRPYEVIKLAKFPINIMRENDSSYSEIVEYEKEIPLNEMIVVGNKSDMELSYKYVPYFYYCVDDEDTLQSVIHEKQARYICVVDNMEWEKELMPQCVYEINETNGETNYSLFTKVKE